jgi:hypothetical protein
LRAKDIARPLVLAGTGRLPRGALRGIESVQDQLGVSRAVPDVRPG